MLFCSRRYTKKSGWHLVGVQYTFANVENTFPGIELNKGERILLLHFTVCVSKESAVGGQHYRPSGKKFPATEKESSQL